MSTIKDTIKSSLRTLGVGVTKYSTLEKLFKNERAGDDLELLLAMPNDQASQLVKYLRNSKSQLRQDLFVLAQLKFKRNGFFVEFGATNGVNLSNTHLLEKEFDWNGILAEPAQCWHKELQVNRGVNIETHCVWRDSKSTLTFNEADMPELSTISAFSGADLHKKARKQGRTYEVKTISLNDLLRKHGAPDHMDYLSIDTEGSEFEILNSLDYNKYTFQIITCEHNFSPMRQQIFDLLSKNGYARRFQELSKFDDWYIKEL
jgi:FkbM family methyltransferase